MKTLKDLNIVSGGFISPLSGVSTGEIHTLESFNKPIIGYTQTFLYTRYEGHDTSNLYEAYYFIDVYEILPIYAPA